MNKRLLQRAREKKREGNCGHSALKKVAKLAPGIQR